MSNHDDGQYDAVRYMVDKGMKINVQLNMSNIEDNSSSNVGNFTNDMRERIKS